MKFQTHRLFQFPNGLTITLAAIALKSILEYLELNFPGDEIVVIVLAIGAAALRWLNMQKDQIVQPVITPSASPYAGEFTRSANGTISEIQTQTIGPSAESTGEKFLRFLIG